MTKQQSSGKAVTHALQMPYSEPIWPSVTPDSETVILNTLIPSIRPVGLHHEQQKAQATSNAKESIEGKEVTEAESEDFDQYRCSERPAIAEHLTIGFNSTVRHLELLSQHAGLPEYDADKVKPSNFAAIFVNVTALPDVMLQPLPLLVAFANKGLAPSDAIRLVPITQAGASRIAEALGHPRAAVCGLFRSAPDIDGLSAILAQQVDIINVPWVHEASNSQYRLIKVQTEETGGKDKASRKRKREKEELK